MSQESVTDMPYVRLGNSGLKISKIILGCMSYGSGTGAWFPWCLNEEESIQQIKTAYDAGINTFDTANAYSNGESEVILGKAIKQHMFNRDKIVVLTKVYGTVSPEVGAGTKFWNRPNAERCGYVNQQGLSRKHIFAAIKDSLRRLDLEYVDVLQCHRFDDETPIEETMNALHDVVKAGYARYIGMSSCYAWQFHIMQNYAIKHNLTPFISMQNQYNLLYREEEREMIPTLQHFGVGMIPWAPVARGVLTRPLQGDTTKRGETEWMFDTLYGKHDGTFKIVERVEEIAKRKGISMAQVALAWCMSKPNVAAPIIGTTSMKNLLDAIASVKVTLTKDEVEYLEQPYQTQPVFSD